MKYRQGVQSLLIETLKRITIPLVLCLLLVTSPLFGVGPIVSASTSYWVEGDYPTLTMGATTLPILPSGNRNCYETYVTYQSFTKKDGTFSSVPRDITTNACMIKSDLGLIGDGFIKLGNGYAYRVTGGATVEGVPGHSAFMWSRPAPNNQYGRIFNFSKTFMGSTFEPTYVNNGSGTSQEFAVRFIQSNDPAKDSAGNNLRVNKYVFSQNGKWMLAEIMNLGIARVNTENGAIQLISTEWANYLQGFLPQMELAISNDGNYAIKSGRFVGETTVYDLRSCLGGAFTVGAINNTGATSGCRSRSVQANLREQVGGFDRLVGVNFDSTGSAIDGFVVRQNSLGVIEVRPALYALAGYEQPKASYIALGDSFSSGQGARSYEVGTDEPENMCHVSKNSYPYLINAGTTSGQNDEFHNVACSGAVSHNIGAKQSNRDFPTRNDLGAWVPGYRPQKSYLNLSPSPNFITLTIGGNDVGFASKLKTCVTSAKQIVPMVTVPTTCELATTAEVRAGTALEIANLKDELVATYKDIIEATNSSTKIYVLGYPQLASTSIENCALNVGLDRDERIFVSESVKYMNQIIKAAASEAGVFFVDTEDSLEGHNLCSGASRNQIGMNGVTARGTNFDESYHPNQFGHTLLADTVLSATNGDPNSHNVCPDGPADTIICPVGHTPIPLPNSAYFGQQAYDYVERRNNSWQGIGTMSVVAIPQPRSVIVDNKPTVKASTINVSVENLKPGTRVTVSIHSTPTELASYVVGGDGTLDTEVTIPDDLAPGYHTVHVTGQNIAGEPIDYYESILVTGPEGDLDGDGIADEVDPCGFVPASGEDSDHDGIDDACDGVLEQTDTTPPNVTAQTDRGPNGSGWYNADVTVSWTATDPEPSSGVVTQPATTTASNEGANEYESDQSCDPAGNCATGKTTVKIDKTAPNISYTLTPAPNANSWNKSSVTVNFTCNDPTSEGVNEVSGIASCPEPQTTPAEDGTYIISGIAQDNAGNESEISLFIQNDSTAPAITPTISPAANSAGWHNTDVTVHFDCADTTAGITTCSDDSLVTNEGETAVNGTATDAADNTSQSTSQVKIDKTAPLVSGLSLSRQTKSVLENSDLHVFAADGLSGITEGEYFLGDTDPGQGNGAALARTDDGFATTFGADFPTGVYKVSVRARDTAGNWSQPVSDYLVVYNPDGPRMTGKRSIIPSLLNGDKLPGLTQEYQTNKATFGFSVKYNRHDDISRNSDLEFKYETGSHCHDRRRAQNCHSFEFNATSINWLTTYGINTSQGMFEGTGIMKIDGIKTVVAFRASGLDADRLGTNTDDSFAFAIYPFGSDTNTAQPLYKVNAANILRGNIKILDK